jgi:hypothetical protein
MGLIMSSLSIDRQQSSEICDHCGQQYTVSRGSVYNDGAPFALYLAGMHGCGARKSVVLAIAIKRERHEKPTAVSIQVWPEESEYKMAVLEPKVSPWRTHTYLGRMLTRKQALASPLIDMFFHIADVVVADNRDVRSFFESKER